MRTKIILLFVLAFAMKNACAQSSQQGALLKQIAALKVYGEYIQKGYSVVKKGLGVIGDFKNGELGLHSDYFESLGSGMVVSDGITAAKIISLHEKIIMHAGRLQQNLDVSLLSQDEISYCQRVKSRLMENCWHEIDHLYDLMTDQTLQMDDAKRLESIDAICQEMLGNYAFIKKFSADTELLIREREREYNSIEKSKKLYNIN